MTETGDSHQAIHRPIVIITSNAEKELPDPFLRRCVFHYIQFPGEELMTRIVRVHHPDIGETLLELCLEKFYWLREIFTMYPLSVQGVEELAKDLSKG